jgi:hypothetical protein
MIPQDHISTNNSKKWEGLLPMRLEEATKIVLKKLPQRRMRDVLEKRFGLRGGKKKTLEAIGKEYKITRERVRQIEADALKSLSKPENLSEIEPLLKALESHLKDHGEVMSEHHLLTTLVDSKYHQHAIFLLTIAGPLHYAFETDYYHNRWAVSKEKAQVVEKVMASVVGDLSNSGKAVSQNEIYSRILEYSKTPPGFLPGEKALESYLNSSKLISSNPYGEYGLISWPTINPRGVRDKAYLVLSKYGKPMHFREVASVITGVGWSRKKAHPQTVHNELIKDSRFVLVGRGLYALKEWGYEQGTVKDILKNILKKAGRPVFKDEIISLVLEKRFVKPPTILLNLQNKELFKKTDGDKYTLV